MFLNRRVFLRRASCAVAGWTMLASLPAYLRAQATGNYRLPRSTPEAQGVATGGILAFLEAIGNSKHEFHSFLLARHGQVVAEGWWAPYRAELNHTMYSMSKSFTSTGIGLAVAEGRLKVDDRVTSFFPEALPEKISDNLAALRVKDLLTMSVGHAQDSTGALCAAEDWVKTFLALPIKYQPGTVFLYNSGATYMLSAIVQKVTGQTLIDYLTPRLFAPLGIEGMTWETCPRGINTGGWGLNIRTEGLARFGQMYLQKGRWNNRQVLPAPWIAEATSFKIQQPVPPKPNPPKERNDWLQGYCYQFWRSQHNAFRGDGAFGQFTIVMPDQDAVLAITSESPSMQGELDLVWEHLLPAMKNQPLPADEAAQSRLQDKLASLALPPPVALSTSPVAAKVSNQPFMVESNSLKAQSMLFRFQNNSALFTLRDGQQEYPITCGLGKWAFGETAMPGTPPSLVKVRLPRPSGPAKLASSGTWKDENTFEMTWRFYETPHHDTVTCRFTGDQVKVEFMNSITQMNPAGIDQRPALLGKLQT